MRWALCLLPLALAWVCFYVLDPILDKRAERKAALRYLARQRHPSNR